METGRCCTYPDYGRNGNDEAVRSAALPPGGKQITARIITDSLPMWVKRCWT
jgi:hypothetical protein